MRTISILIPLLVLVLGQVACPSCAVSATNDAQQRSLERLAEAALSAEKPVRERARQNLRPWLEHQDLGLRAKAFALYGRLFAPSDEPVARMAFWTNGREHLPSGSAEQLFCSLGLAHALTAQRRYDEARTLADEVRTSANQASPAGIDAVVTLGLINAAQDTFDGARAALTLAEWIIQQGPDYAVAGYQNLWLTSLRNEIDRLDPGAEQRCWITAENARGDGRWGDALAAYRTYLARWPSNPQAVAADWAIGLCTTRTGDKTSGVAHWQEFIARDPTGPYRGLAWLGLTDVSLIDDLDPVEAQQRIAKGLALCGTYTANAAPADIRSAWNQLHLRAALVAYVHQDRALVDRHLAEAAAISDPLPTPQPNGGLATPMAPAAPAMVEFLKGGGELVPPSARDRGRAKASLALVVAAFLDRVDQEALAIAAYERLLIDDFPASPNQRACALLGLATAHHDRFNVDGQVAAYARVIEEFPHAPVVPRTMYRMAIAMYARQFKNEQARTVLDDILRRFPNDEVAPDARFYRLLTNVWDKHWEAAAADLAALNQRYPNHSFREVINNALRQRIADGLSKTVPSPTENP